MKERKSHGFGSTCQFLGQTTPLKHLNKQLFCFTKCLHLWRPAWSPAGCCRSRRRMRVMGFWGCLESVTAVGTSGRSGSAALQLRDDVLEPTEPWIYNTEKEKETASPSGSEINRGLMNKNAPQIQDKGVNCPWTITLTLLRPSQLKLNVKMN